MQTTDDQNEVFDIVDEQNRVIDRGTRAEIHRKALRHRAVHIVVRNSAGEIFVQLRSKSKDNNPGLWDSSAAGHVNSGESYIDCAIRELFEELGIEASAEGFHLIGQRQACENNGFEFQNIYCVSSDAQITLHADEVDDGKWMSQSMLEAWLVDEPTLFTADFIHNWGLFKSWDNNSTGVL